MNKKYYESPMAEIDKFTIQDVLTVSTQDKYDDEDDLGGGSGAKPKLTPDTEF